METAVHLVRHGQVHNLESIRYGLLAGFGLAVRGRKQALGAARFLRTRPRPIAAIVASPLQRAVETATILQQHLALPAITVDDRVIEAPSQFDGMPKTAFLWPSMWPRLANPFRPSWAEPFEHVAHRMRAAIDDHRRAHDGDVVIVSHQAPIWLARHSFEASGPPWLSRVRCSPASVTTLHFVGDRFERSTYWAPSRLAALLG